MVFKTKKVKDIKKITPQKEITQQKEYPIFDFRYLTKNKNFNFDFFSISKEKVEAKAKILDRILELQEYDWLELMTMRKNIGFETLQYGQIKFQPNNMKLEDDDKVIVFRLNSQIWRMIGIKSLELKNVFHIIGFDFDYNAYNHG